MTARPCRAVLCSLAGLTLLSAQAQEGAGANWLVSFSANTLFNASARLKGQPGSAPLAGANAQPGAENYDNGFVGPDVSGDPSLSTYWGYNDASQQIISGSDVIGLTFDRTTAPAGLSSPELDADPGVGGELLLRRLISRSDSVGFGWEFGASFNRIEMTDSASYSTDGQRTTYSYNMAAPINSALFPPPGYQGPFNGLGPVINLTPTVGSSVVAPNAVHVSNSSDIEANIFGFRVGPYLELPVTSKLSACASAGALLAVVNTDVRWSQTQTVDSAGANGYWTGSSSVSDSGTDVTFGFYLGVDAGYQLDPNWRLVCGARYQNAGTASHSLGQGKLDLDLGQTFMLNLGLGYSF